MTEKEDESQAYTTGRYIMELATAIQQLSNYLLSDFR
jgi:hypothetical protein